MEFYERLKLLGLGGPPWTGEAKAQFWESVAHLAVRTFEGKDQYMSWVCKTYQAEDNRFAASVCWDIIKLKAAQIEGKTDA
jgi:hypothetical protein